MPILNKFTSRYKAITHVLGQKRGRMRPGVGAVVKKMMDRTTAKTGGVADMADIPCLDLACLERQLILPCNTETSEEKIRAKHQDLGQYLVRQDRWQELSRLIRQADHGRAMTPGGMAYAELLAYGARADVVQAVEDAIFDGATPDLSGIEAFEAILTEAPEDPAIAVIVAHAHMDIGWAWRGDGHDDAIKPRHLALFQAHFSRAQTILDQFCGVELDAPSIAAARVALLAASERPQDNVADDYEDLIDLDPANPRVMRAMGNHLLPRWFGSYDQLELEARRTASRTLDIWGAGGYTWCYMDALAVDSRAIEQLDVGFFVEGLRDILERRPDQHMANQIAAYCAITMASERVEGPDETARAKIYDCFDWVLSNHLRELHPLIWAQAAHGPDIVAALKNSKSPREALWRHGHKTARQIIARHFHEDLTQGATITFSRHGLRLYPAM
ncbi:MAG: hypothetical protein Q9M48_14185 [Rhodobacterales bacterium]|nr:hypothetical protein [Rhodobacterales bacterium]